MEIPLHRLEKKTSAGIYLSKININEPIKVENEGKVPHRDDHFVFFIVTKGAGTITVDFREIELKMGNVYFITPSQIRLRKDDVIAEGWILAVDSLLIPRECKDIFEIKMHTHLPFMMEDGSLAYLNTLATLLYDALPNSVSNLQRKATQGLLTSILCTIAVVFQPQKDFPINISRIETIAKDFGQLLSIHFRSIKSPTEFAKMMNISETYLNEALKKQTGYNVSYWIQQQVVLETKRLLYFSNMSVKEIAYAMGYTDQSYFCRLFRKVTGQSATSFRHHYQK